MLIRYPVLFAIGNNLSYLIAIMIYASSAFQTARAINIDTVQRIYSETNILSKTMPAVSVGEARVCHGITDMTRFASLQPILPVKF